MLQDPATIKTNYRPAPGKTTSDASWTETQEKYLQPVHEAVVRLLCVGHTVKYIAKKLEIGENYVRRVKRLPEVQQRIQTLMPRADTAMIKSMQRVTEAAFAAADLGATFVERENKKSQDNEKHIPNPLALQTAEKILDRVGIGKNINSPDTTGGKHMHFHSYNVNEEKRDKLMVDFANAQDAANEINSINNTDQESN